MHFLQLALFALFLWFVGDNVLRGNIRRIIKLYLLYIIYIYRARLCGEKCKSCKVQKVQKLHFRMLGWLRHECVCLAVSDMGALRSRTFAPCGYSQISG